MKLGRALAAMPALVLGACQLNTPVYFGAPVPALAVVPVAGSALPRAESGISLRFRNPGKDEQAALAKQAAALGFDVPWIQRSHVHLELTYQVTSNEPPPADGGAPAASDAASFTIGIDGANEYTKYDENIVSQVLQQGSNDPPTYLPLLAVTPQAIAPGQTISGTVREDDFAEAELDLYAIGKWMAPYTAVLINNSQVNPIGLEMVPPNAVIPALIEVDVNFTANREMTCVYALRVRDDNNQLLYVATDTLFSPAPALFQPAPPPKT